MVSSNSAESSVDNSSFQVPNTQGLQEQVTARLCLYAVRCRKRRSFRGNRSTDRNMGCGIGVGLSWTILKIISVALDQAFRLSGQVLAIAAGFSVAMGMLFGVYPANQAAKKHPKLSAT